MCEVISPPHLSSVKDTGNKRVSILRKNKPISGSFSPWINLSIPENPVKLPFSVPVENKPYIRPV
jgi:hypothetical protein